jgi:hypothetical protein
MMVRRVVCSLLLSTALAGTAAAQAAPSTDALAAAKELAQILDGESMSQMPAAITAQVWGAMEPQLTSRVDAATLGEIRIEFERAVGQLSTEVMQETPAILRAAFQRARTSRHARVL